MSPSWMTWGHDDDDEEAKAMIGQGFEACHAPQKKVRFDDDNHNRSARARGGEIGHCRDRIKRELAGTEVGRKRLEAPRSA